MSPFSLVFFFLSPFVFCSNMTIKRRLIQNQHDNLVQFNLEQTSNSNTFLTHVRSISKLTFNMMFLLEIFSLLYSNCLMIFNTSGFSFRRKMWQKKIK